MSSHSFEFDFVISYAGEDIAFARDLERLLTNGRASVFFAPEFQAEIWGKNLYEYLAEIYGRKGRFCILLVSKYYVEKKWTRHEWRSAQERALNDSNSEYILPIRLDETELPGLLSTTAYLDANDLSNEKIARLALLKLQGLVQDTGSQNEPRESGSYTPNYNPELFYTGCTTFEDHISTLLEQNKLTSIKRYLVEAPSTFFSHISQLEDTNINTVEQVKGNKLIPILDNLVAIGVVSIKYSDRDLFSAVVGSLHNLFSTAHRFTFSPGIDLNHLDTIWVWRELITRIYVLGALLIKHRLFSWASLLIRQDVSWIKDYSSFWSRFILTKLSRKKGRAELLCRLAIQHIQNNEYLGPLFLNDEDLIIETTCQYDFIQGVHVLQVGKDPYPSFGDYYNHRTTPIISELVKNTEAREAIPNIDDPQLASFIDRLDEMAANEFVRSGTWDRNFWLDDSIINFLSEHLSSEQKLS